MEETNSNKLISEDSLEILGYIHLTGDDKGVIIDEMMPITERKTVLGRNNNLSYRIHDLRVSRNQCELILKDVDGKREAVLVNLTKRETTSINGVPLRYKQEVVVENFQKFCMNNFVCQWILVESIKKNSTFTSEISSDKENIEQELEDLSQNTVDDKDKISLIEPATDFSTVSLASLSTGWSNYSSIDSSTDDSLTDESTDPSSTVRSTAPETIPPQTCFIKKPVGYFTATTIALVCLAYLCWKRHLVMGKKCHF